MRAIAGVGLLIFLGFAVAPLAGQEIRITEFQVEGSPPDGEMKITLNTQSKDIELGSFCIRLADSTAPAPPPGFVRQPNGYDYLQDAVGGLPLPNLADNGPLDEDPRSGGFAITISTTTWPPGKYLLMVAAHNRPAGGPYVEDSRPVAFRIGGDGEPVEAVGNVPGAEHRVVYEKPGVYACFPSLTIRPDGRLTTSFGTRTRRSHIDNSGGSLTLDSGDGGLTWTAGEHPVVDRRWQTRDGLLATAAARGWIQTDAKQREELKSQGKTVLPVRDGVIAYLGGASSRVSRDGGKSWESHVIDVPEYVSGLMGFHHAASELAAADGLRLVAVYGARIADVLAGRTSRDEVFLLRSADDGQTWQCLPMLPEGLGDSKVGFNETALVEAGDGRILALMRTAPETSLYQSFSSDRGLTWTKPADSGISGHPAHLLLLKDGRLLATYGYRKRPTGIRACFSGDHGQTWQTDREWILRNDGFGSPGDLGYPLTHALDDGRLMTIYYLTTDGMNTHIATTHWEPPK